MGTSARTCIDIDIPLNLSARTGIFNTPTPASNFDATAFIQNVTQQGRNYSEDALVGYRTTTNHYKINAQFCTPSGPQVQSPVLQVLTHGLGFDKSYWDLSYDNFNYSYVEEATDKYNYCTFSYDRLGLGASSHGDPINEIQASLQVAALTELTLMLRKGTIPGIPEPFGKIVHVGHSFGSALTYALVAGDPSISDGIVLTGFSLNSSFITTFHVGGNFQQANLNQPFRFGSVPDPTVDIVAGALRSPIAAFDNRSVQQLLQTYELVDFITGLQPTRQRVEYTNGYLTNADASANQFLFLQPGNFDPHILTFVEETKQPITAGEILTSGESGLNTFTGPVMVITGSNDLPFCGGDCLATGDPSLPSIPAEIAKAFTHIDPKNFGAYIQPDTGHGINLHYNATGAYAVINAFLRAHGLATP